MSRAEVIMLLDGVVIFRFDEGRDQTARGGQWGSTHLGGCRETLGIK